MDIAEIKENFYSTDVAAEILATLIARENSNTKLKELIHERQLIYGLTGTAEEQNNAFLKVFNFYAPALKNENEADRERSKFAI